MKIFKNTILAIFGLMIFSCSNQEDKGDLTISGVMEGGADQQLILEYISPKKAEAVDTVIIGEDGSYGFSYQVSEIGFYRIKQNDQNFITLIIQPGEIIKLNSKLDLGMNSYNIEGSPQSIDLKGMNEQMARFYALRDSLTVVFQANEGNQVILKQLQMEYAAFVEDNMEYVRNFIRENPSSFACLAGAEQLSPDTDFELYQLIDKSLAEKYGSSTYYIEFHKAVEAMSKLSIGSQAPDIILPNAGGEMVSLSSLRGKVVLLDFWASWCKPCRMENPNVVAAYKKYNEKGFEIYGVSLDKERGPWLKAIDDDRLHWTQVSDLKFWNSAVVKLYDIKGIPFALLLDKDGKIIAKNLRGPALHQKLEEILN